MKRITIVAAVLVLSLSTVASAQQFCYQDAGSPARPDAMPTAEDRRVFDQTLVAYVAKAATTANEANGLANKLLWKRSQKFMPQPREYASSVPTHLGAVTGVKWDAEEQALWEAIMTSALREGGAGYRPVDPKLADRAFYTAWEVMMHRRMQVVYDCF